MASHLLYIEDDPLLQKAVSRELRLRFTYVQTASSLAEARAHARSGVPWCGFISDQGLPDGDGLDLIMELRESCPAVPAILITGQKELELARLCVARDVRYLPKPFQMEHLEPFFREVDAYLRSPVGPAFEAFAVGLRATARERDVLSTRARSHPGSRRPL